METLSAEIDASPFGLLDTYPEMCFPTDVIAALAMIRRADAVLGTDHSEIVERARRGFRRDLVDGYGLPPWSADPRKGVMLRPSQGCGNSYACLFSPELWPDLSAAWYATYEQHFWQRRLGAQGFREFPMVEGSPDWYLGVDAGPVMFGYGFAAGAFGVGAARVNGRFDHAFPISAEMLALSWPLPDGTLALPRLLSNAAHAPYLGECAILFFLTRQPLDGVSADASDSLPPFVWIILGLCLLAGLLLILLAALKLRRARRLPERPLPAARLQFSVWGFLTVGGLAVIFSWSPIVGFAMLLAAQVPPRGLSRRTGARNAVASSAVPQA